MESARILLLWLFTAAFTLGGFPAAAQTGDLTGDPEKGERLYQKYSCYACHGYTGETGSGTRLNPPRLDQAGFIAYVRRGNMSRRSPPAGSWMPAYAGEDVTDQDLADIYVYITSLQATSPPLEDIPLLRE